MRKILFIILITAALLTVLFSCVEKKDPENEKESDNMTQNTELNTGENDVSNIKDVTPKKKIVGIVIADMKPSYLDGLISGVKNLENVLVNEVKYNDIKSLFDIEKNDAVILPDAAFIPYGTNQAIKHYLDNGGKLITLGGPPLSETIYPDGENWKVRSELLNEAASGSDKFELFSFDKEADTKNWERSTNTPDNKQSVKTGDFASPDGSSALCVILENMAGWDTISKKVKIPDEYNSIGLYVKGAPQTTSLCLELQEKDGSRWFAVFNVSTEWQFVILSPKDFLYWQDSSSKNRGGDGDAVIFKNASLIRIGLAQSHTPVALGPHEYYLDNICSLNFDLLTSESELIIDGLSPQWKFYPITNAKSAKVFDNQIFVKERNYVLPEKNMVSPSPRPQGNGFDRGKESRFVPLIEIYDEKNLRSGFLAWLTIKPCKKEISQYKSTMIAGFGALGEEFYNDDGIAAVIDVVQVMLGDAVFVEAGASEYIYVESETKSVPIGFELRDAGIANLSARYDLYLNDEVIKSEIKTFDNENSFNYKQSYDYDLLKGKPDRVVFTLLSGDIELDRISQDIVFWSPKPENERKYITVGNNEFLLEGVPLRLYGVNFMPTSGIGVNAENGAYFEYYVSSQSYDPDVFYKDLLRVKEVGFNSISLFVYYDTAMDTKNMLHLIDMCDKLGLYVDLSIRPHANPFDFNDYEVTEMIKALHIAELDNVIAYDIAWERYFGTYEGSYGNPSGRKEYDSEFEKWVIKNYGSVENAEKEWGVTAQKNGSSLMSPSDEMLRTDGVQTKMVAAYRRFADDFISKKHIAVADTIKQVDKNHLISARLGAPGGIPLADPGDMGYDLQALASAFDFMSPETYVINSDISQANQGIFTNAYARFARPFSPVMWKEFGQHIWSGSNFNDMSAAQKSQADYYTAIYDMALAGHTGAMYCWWWAGGYRTNENSDFGIMNPDGSDRLVTAVIRLYRDKFMNQPELGAPEVFFEINRDLSATGIKEMYLSIKDVFLAAVNSGKSVALRDKATGMNSESVTDEAVGGGAAGENNPARYINGEFRAVYVKLENGTYKQVSFGNTVKIPKGAVELKVIYTNISGAAWLSEKSSGNYVSLVSSGISDIKFELPLGSDVSYLETVTQEFRLCEDFGDKAKISFRFGIKDRFVFADSFEFTVTAE